MHVVTTRQADTDIDQFLRRLKKKYSPLSAAKWYAAITAAFESLEIRPERCPLAAEELQLAVELRELIVRRYRGVVYRILFRIKGDTVIIHRVRYARQRAVTEAEL